MLNEAITGRIITAAHRTLKALLEHVKEHVPKPGANLPPYGATDPLLITYADVCNTHIQMDSILPRHMGQVLDVVREACLQSGTPDLAALVVNKSTGRPGERYVLQGAAWSSEIDRIRNFNWASVPGFEFMARVKLL